MSRTRQPAQSIEDLEERRLRALVAVSTAVGSVDDLDEVLEAAAEATRDALGVTSVSISRWERDRARIRTLINVGELGPGEHRRPEDESYALADYPAIERLLTGGEPHLTARADPGADRAERALLAQLDKACAAAVAIVFRGEVWGEFYVTRAAGMAPISAADVSFMEVVAAQIAVAVGRAEALSDLQLAAYRDPLTGLANRRAFDERLASALARDGDEVVLMFADVDRLKAINDEQGHEAGDRALRAAAAVLAAVADDATLAARIGGDEFGLVLEGRGRADAEALIAAVDRRLADAACVSMSWGVATTAEQLRAVPALMRAADAAQYAAKERARRRGDVVGDPLAPYRPGPPSDAFGQRFGSGLAAALRHL